MTAISLVPRTAARGPRFSCLLAALLVLVVAGCRVTEDFLDPDPEWLAWSPPLPVTLSNELRGFKSSTVAGAAKTRFKVGKLLQRLFLSSDGRHFLSCIDAKLDLSLRENLWHTRYTLVLAFQSEGNYQLLQASGQANSITSARASGRQAIEGCVADLYRQVSALLPRNADAR